MAEAAPCEAGELSGRCVGGSAIEVCNDGTVSTYDCTTLCQQDGFASGTCAPSGAGDDCACTAEPPTEGEVGDDCNIDAECDSAYYRTPAGGIQGVCAVNGFGTPCQQNAACEYGVCIGDRDTDDWGYCTATCESFSDRPSFWECGELGNAAGTFCIQDS